MNFQQEETLRKEWNKFATLCLKDEGYSSETIKYVLFFYKGWDLTQHKNNGKLEYATVCLNYARHITEY
jgi:hypothetical protein